MESTAYPGKKIGDVEIQILVNGNLTNLTWLAVVSNEVDDGGAQALAAGNLPMIR